MNEFNHTDIAVIGLSARFPGANSVTAFWDNIINGVESVSFFSDDELEQAGVDSAEYNHPNYVKAGAIINDIERFDATFFGFSPREAEILDPQQRLFLECAWEALENGSCDPSRFDGYIGVFSGAADSGYFLHHIYPRRHGGDLAHSAFQVDVATNSNFLATRTAYKLNLRGPSINVNTACSTSLVAIHLACQSLISGDCDVALAGGVTLQIPQKQGYPYEKGMVLAADGHCYAYDDRAQGTVSGSGVGVVMLKPLQDAVADGNEIYAVIKGSAINNDGNDKVGFTAPSINGQASVIAEAMALAGVEADTIGLVEGHGTGTELGDPIEVHALTQAYRESTNKLGFCALGSVKTNVGHLDAAAGVCGFIKATMALYTQKLPPSLNFETANSKIKFKETPFFINTTTQHWCQTDHPRRAAVSSFGIGGTNAHVILEEAPAVLNDNPQAKTHQLLTFSARSEAACSQIANNLAAYLTANNEAKLTDVAYSLNLGRKAFGKRNFVVAKDTTAAVRALKQPVGSLAAFATPTIGFLFPGQGSQHINMARTLYSAESHFTQTVNECLDFLKLNLKLDLGKIIFPSNKKEKWATEQLTKTANAQPALFIIEYALANLWQSWGIQPVGMLGHSIGEIVAACLADVFSWQDGLRLVVKRGQLMQSLPTGAMLSVALAEKEVKPFLPEGVTIAALNAPNSTVVSGPSELIDACASQLVAAGYTVRRLHTSHAFHSAMMKPILQPLTRFVSGLQLNAPTSPFISNVTGDWISAEKATDPAYWASHLREPVKFAQGLATLKEQANVLVEVGPGQTLKALAQRQTKGDDFKILASLPHPRSNDASDKHLLETLGRVWQSGGEIDWSALYDDKPTRFLHLPTYPFERQRYWLDLVPDTPNSVPNKLDESRQSMDDWFYAPAWQRSFSPVVDGVDSADFLVLTGSDLVGPAIAKQLKQQGQRVVVAQLANTFTQTSKNAFSVTSSTLKSLFEQLNNEQRPPQQIVCAWSVSEATFSHLLALTKAIGAVLPTENITLSLITQNAYDVTGREPLAPKFALAIAPSLVLPQEMLNKRTRVIDLEDGAARTVRCCVNELLAEANETVIAMRGGHRWTQNFDKIALAARSSRLKQHGVYVITGGTGGMGLTLAKHLTDTYSAKVMLIARTWSAEIDSLNNGEVWFESADISDSKALQRILGQVSTVWGHIDGVFHTAGVAGSGVMQLKTASEAADVLRPKVQGTNVLLNALTPYQPAFVMLFSSLRSITAGPGQSDYMAANLYLDLVAQAHRHQQPRIISVNWDGWREVGMSADATPIDEHDTTLANALTPAEGIGVIEKILAQAEPQIAVSTISLATQIAQQSQPASVATELSQPTASYERPSLATAFAEAQTTEEKVLVGIWQQLLGINKIGVHDNFFELGGDSIVSIQMVARAKTAGYSLDAQQIFEQQTIAKIAPTMRSGQLVSAEQNTIIGRLPLTPIQQWYFDQKPIAPHHFNQSVLLDLPASVTAGHAQAAIDKLVAHHDALRLRFRHDSAGWQAFNADLPSESPFALIDLRDNASPSAALIDHAAAVQTGFDLMLGPLLTSVFYQLPTGNRLLIVIHHLVIDGLSWRILQVDLETLLAGGELPAKTTSYRLWAKRLKKMANSKAVRNELAYWKTVAFKLESTQVQPHPPADNAVKDARTLVSHLDSAETTHLLNKIAPAYALKFEELLLAAVGFAIQRWSANASPVIDVESFGRPTTFKGIDISRTVGWFTSIYPQAFELSTTGDWSQRLNAAKAQIRAVPGDGFNYGLLKYMHDAGASLQNARNADLVFLYLGQGDGAARAKTPDTIQPATESVGNNHAPTLQRFHKIELACAVENGQLTATWCYGSHLYEQDEIESLATAFSAILREFVIHEPKQPKDAVTDFPLAKLSKKRLGKLAKLLGN